MNERDGPRHPNRALPSQDAGGQSAAGQDQGGQDHGGQDHGGQDGRRAEAGAATGKTITKADIIESVYEKVGFSKKESSEIVEIVFETIKRTLEKGEKIKISGFGKFEVRQKNTRRGRNPQTGSELQIPARRVLSFKPSQVLKNALAGEGGDGAGAGDDDDLD